MTHGECTKPENPAWRALGGSNSHADRLRQTAIERVGLTALVVRPALDQLSGGFVQHGDLLIARVKIATYNQPAAAGSAPYLPSLGRLTATKFTRRKEPTPSSSQPREGLSEAHFEISQTAERVTNVKIVCPCAQNAGRWSSTSGPFHQLTPGAQSACESQCPNLLNLGAGRLWAGDSFDAYYQLRQHDP